MTLMSARAQSRSAARQTRGGRLGGGRGLGSRGQARDRGRGRLGRAGPAAASAARRAEGAAGTATGRERSGPESCGSEGGAGAEELGRGWVLVLVGGGASLLPAGTGAEATPGRWLPRAGCGRRASPAPRGCPRRARPPSPPAPARSSSLRRRGGGGPSSARGPQGRTSARGARQSGAPAFEDFPGPQGGNELKNQGHSIGQLTY